MYIVVHYTLISISYRIDVVSWMNCRWGTLHSVRVLGIEWRPNVLLVCGFTPSVRLHWWEMRNRLSAGSVPDTSKTKGTIMKSSGCQVLTYQGDAVKKSTGNCFCTNSSWMIPGNMYTSKMTYSFRYLPDTLHSMTEGKTILAAQLESTQTLLPRFAKGQNLQRCNTSVFGGIVGRSQDLNLCTGNG